MMKEFTDDEKNIARHIDKEYKWIARDSDGNLCIYEEKPEKEEYAWYNGVCKYIYYFNHLFSAIKWEDEEPTRISDIYNPPILSDAEREYLKTALEPFHEKVKFVEKRRHTYAKEYLFIHIHDGMLEFPDYDLGKMCTGYDGMVEFPDFDSGKMYSGMEPDKEYKLDELGITYNSEA